MNTLNSNLKSKELSTQTVKIIEEIIQEQKNELSMTLNRQVNQIAHELSILNLKMLPQDPMLK